MDAAYKNRGLRPPPPKPGSAAAEIVKLRGRLGSSDDDDEDDEWQCRVCKRNNASRLTRCRVCYAPVNYKEPPPTPPPPLPDAPEGLEDLLMAAQESRASAEEAKAKEREKKAVKLKQAGFDEKRIQVFHETESFSGDESSEDENDNLIDAISARAKRMKKEKKNQSQDTHISNEQKAPVLPESVLPAEKPKFQQKADVSTPSTPVFTDAVSRRTTTTTHLKNVPLRLEEFDLLTPRFEKTVEERENHEALRASFQAAKRAKSRQELQHEVHALRLEYDRVRASNREIEKLGAPPDESAYHEALRLQSLIKETKREELEALRLIVRLIGQDAAAALLKSGDISKICLGDLAPLKRLQSY